MVKKELSWTEDKHKMVSYGETSGRPKTEDESSGKTEDEDKTASHEETPGCISTENKG